MPCRMNAPKPKYMFRGLSALSGVQASVSETLMERSYDPKRARASSVHRTLSARRLVRSQQTVSAAHSLCCTHGSPSFIEIVDYVDVYTYHQSLFSLEPSRAQGLRPCHRKPPRCGGVPSLEHNIFKQQTRRSLPCHTLPLGIHV